MNTLYTYIITNIYPNELNKWNYKSGTTAGEHNNITIQILNDVLLR